MFSGQLTTPDRFSYHTGRNKIIKHTKMASAARRQIIGGGAPIIKSRRQLVALTN